MTILQDPPEHWPESHKDVQLLSVSYPVEQSEYLLYVWHAFIPLQKLVGVHVLQAPFKHWPESHKDVQELSVVYPVEQSE